MKKENNSKKSVIKSKKVVTKSISFNLPVKLLDSFTELSIDLGVSRNNLMTMALNEYLVQHDALKQLPGLIEQLQKSDKKSKK